MFGAGLRRDGPPNDKRDDIRMPRKVEPVDHRLYRRGIEDDVVEVAACDGNQACDLRAMNKSSVGKLLRRPDRSTVRPVG